MDQQKITEEELNRELKGNKTTAAVCRLIGKSWQYWHLYAW